MSDMDIFTDNLNPAQYTAVTHPSGPLLVVAGAGSGKTRVLTYRVAWLASQCGVEPARILAVTFTNKAADEMARRVHAQVQARVPVSTFHSWCLRVLREETAHIPYRPHFVVYDQSDQLTLIKDCMRRLNISERTIKPRAIAHAISNAKNRLMNAATFAAGVTQYHEEAIADVYDAYEAALRRANAMDFDDLLMQTVMLFTQNEAVLARHQQRYDHILIDEFQDTNHVQYTLAKLLAAPHSNISVVGDPDQSIYRFRGAEIRNILDFEKDYPDAKIVLLEQNYRSTATILQAANAVINENVDRKDKKLWTDKDGGVPVRIYRAQDEHDEAEFVAETLRNMVETQGMSLKECVVFYRVHALSRVMEDALRRAALPYVIVGDVSFYNRREIKDLIAYCRVIINPDDDVNIQRILNVPTRGIGANSRELIARHVRNTKCSWYAALCAAETIPHLNSTAARRIKDFVDIIEKLRTRRDALLPTQLLMAILEETQYIEKTCDSHDVQDRTRIENIKELISAAADYENTTAEEMPGIEHFLQDIALCSEIDAWNDTTDAVTLMTIHTAKGLEFPCVCIIGMEEDLFPHYNTRDNPVDVEEERRLCHVAMTRAEEKLIMTCAYHRTVFGQQKAREPSRFLHEIPDEFTDIHVSTKRDYFSPDYIPPLEAEPPSSRATTRRGGRKKSVSTAAANATDTAFTNGMHVMHSHFGKGRIESVLGSGEDARLTIVFDGRTAPKVLVAKYAKLTIIE